MYDSVVYDKKTAYLVLKQLMYFARKVLWIGGEKKEGVGGDE